MLFNLLKYWPNAACALSHAIHIALKTMALPSTRALASPFGTHNTMWRV